MKAIKFNLSIPQVLLKKLHLAPKYNMIQYKTDWKEPVLKYPNQVKLKTRLSGICASD